MAKVKRSQTLVLGILTLTLGSFFLLSSCSQEDDWTVDINPLFEVIPPEAPVPVDNPMTEETIDLGHIRFFESRQSRTRIITCIRCQLVVEADIDHSDVAISEQGRLTPRNTPTVYNAAYLKAQFPDGRATTQEEKA